MHPARFVPVALSRGVLLKSLLLGGFAVSACAAEPLDVRLNLVVLPPSDNIPVTYSNPSGLSYSADSDRFNNGWRAEIGMAGCPHRFSPDFAVLISGMLFYGSQKASTYEPGEREVSVMTGPMDMLTMGVDLHLGLQYKLNPYIDVEFTGFVGVGSATVSDTAVSADGPDERVTEEAHGDYEEAGLLLAINAHNKSRSFNIGLGLRYFIAYTEVDNYFNTQDRQGNFHPGGLRENIEIRLGGFAPHLMMGFSF
jgi:hypothetical protein